jgi:hypothetical protein
MPVAGSAGRAGCAKAGLSPTTQPRRPAAPARRARHHKRHCAHHKTTLAHRTPRFVTIHLLHTHQPSPTRRGNARPSSLMPARWDRSLTFSKYVWRRGITRVQRPAPELLACPYREQACVAIELALCERRYGYSCGLWVVRHRPCRYTGTTRRDTGISGRSEHCT